MATTAPRSTDRRLLRRVPTRELRRLAHAAALALAAAAVRGQELLVFQLTLALVYAIAILGLNLLTGFNGQISLGHGAFYAIGAYTAAILMDQCGVAYYWTMPVAGVVCLVVRLPVRPAGAAAGGHLSGARDLLARGGDAADPQVERPRALDRRRPGHRHRQARRALRPAAHPRPVALFLHPRGAARAVCLRRQSRRQPHRPRHGGDPRQSDRGARRWASTCRSTSR